MAQRTDIHKILIIGSGPIVIGQACIYANEHGDLSSNKNLLLLFLAQIAITSAVAVLIKVLSDLVYKGIKKAKRRS